MRTRGGIQVRLERDVGYLAGCLKEQQPFVVERLVGDDERSAAARGDACQLQPCVATAEILVAKMRREAPARRCNLPGERGQLRLGGPRGRLIVQAKRHASGAGRHPRTDERPHPPEILTARGARRPAHHGEPDRPVGCLRQEVAGDPALELPEVRVDRCAAHRRRPESVDPGGRGPQLARSLGREGRPAETVGCGQAGRDALQDGRHGVPAPFQQRRLDVRVRIDEPGCHDRPVDVEHARGARILQIAERDDRVAIDADVEARRDGVPRAVYHDAAAQQHVERLRAGCLAEGWRHDPPSSTMTVRGSVNVSAIQRPPMRPNATPRLRDAPPNGMWSSQ